jgi:uncharacterized membrane protein
MVKEEEEGATGDLQGNVGFIHVRLCQMASETSISFVMNLAAMSITKK